MYWLLFYWNLLSSFYCWSLFSIQCSMFALLMEDTASEIFWRFYLPGTPNRQDLIWTGGSGQHESHPQSKTQPLSKNVGRQKRKIRDQSQDNLLRKSQRHRRRSLPRQWNKLYPLLCYYTTKSTFTITPSFTPTISTFTITIITTITRSSPQGYWRLKPPSLP